jgi:DNA-binding response OmpR family regulator
VPRKLLIADLNGKGAFRSRFVAEGFLVDNALSPADAAAMMAMSSYDAMLVAASNGDLIASLAATAGQTQRFRPVIGLATMDSEGEVSLLRRGVTCLVPAEITFPELLARLRAILQRCAGFPAHYRAGPLGIDPVARRASLDGVPLSLRSVEFDILLCLAERVNQPVTPAEIHARLWPDLVASSNRLAVHIHQLRSRIDLNPRWPLLHTIRGVGYMLSAEGSKTIMTNISSPRRNPGKRRHTWVRFSDGAPFDTSRARRASPWSTARDFSET